MRNFVTNIILTNIMLLIISELAIRGKNEPTTVPPYKNFTVIRDCMDYIGKKMKESNKINNDESHCKTELAVTIQRNWSWRSLTITFIVLFSLSLFCCIFCALLDLFFDEKDECRIRMYAR